MENNTKENTSNDLQLICESDTDPPFDNSLFLNARKDLDPVFVFLLDWSLKRSLYDIEIKFIIRDILIS